MTALIIARGTLGYMTEHVTTAARWGIVKRRRVTDSTVSRTGHHDIKGRRRGRRQKSSHVATTDPNLGSPPMVRSSAFEHQVVRVLDSDGTPLTIAMTRAVGEDGAVVLGEVEDPGILLDYYFGRGERLVVMELPEQIPTLTVEGSLETWWLAGARQWQIYVDRPLVTLGPVGSAQPEPAGRR
jgi:hypothetical protein